MLIPGLAIDKGLSSTKTDFFLYFTVSVIQRFVVLSQTLRRIFTLLFSPENSNFDSSVQKTLFHYSCCILTFDPAKNAIPRWCTGRKGHILMAVMRGNRVGGNCLMKWDEVKKFPWYTHRLMHRKRVSCETAWQLFPLNDDQTCDSKNRVGVWVGVGLLYNSVKTEVPVRDRTEL